MALQNIFIEHDHFDKFDPMFFFLLNFSRATQDCVNDSNVSISVWLSNQWKVEHSVMVYIVTFLCVFF